MACACGSQPRFGSPCACQTMRVRLYCASCGYQLKPVGELRGVIYRTRRVPGEAPKNYVHFFKRSPLLAADPMGRRLFIIGGQYRVTRRGIEG